MSLLTAEPKELKFLARFENVWSSLRRYQIRQGLCWSFLTVALGLLVLVVADYRLELLWSTRASALASACALALVVFLGRVVAPLRWWTKPRTAVEIEGRFPQLGQRIRTVVQYAGLADEQIDSAGVAPGLVDALEEETETRARPLDLDNVVPWSRVWVSAFLAAIPALILLGGVTANPEWRIALQRALLGNPPYTTLSLTPGNLMVEQGTTVPITIELRGRLGRDVVLYTRTAVEPDAPWKAAALAAPERGPASKRETKLEKVNDPITYRVVAGPAKSKTFLIDVRYPLSYTTFEAALQPPSYTGVKPSTVKGGDLHVIEGTGVKFRIAFDAKPAEATMIVIDPNARPLNKKDKTPPPPQVVPLKDEGSVYTAELNLTKGLVYRIEAHTTSGRVLPKNRYRIDVREDRPPQVRFEEPDEALEVHPIAEVMNRIRAADDFGLSKVGIVFRFNNGDEQTLVMKDFSTQNPEKNKTAAALQEWLLLEKLAATPTDSLAYYAFAEDNYPSAAKRTETDLRYIDIRPFKREYKAAEEGDAGEQGEDELATLAELIARQRFNLNRTVRMAKHKPTDKTFAEDPLKIATFEETLANQTRELTEGLEGIVGQRVEPLHQAEESMLAAVEAIDRVKNVDAPRHMGDALRHLIEARDTLRVIIGAKPELAQALRKFDRQQAQKIRKPKNDSDDAEAIAEQIEELAQEEDFVYATLASLGMTGDEPAKSEKNGKKGESEKGEEEAEKKDPKDGEKGSPGTKGQQPGPGSEGPKGSGTGKGQPGDPEKQDSAGDDNPKADGKGDEKKPGDGDGDDKEKAVGKGKGDEKKPGGNGDDKEKADGKGDSKKPDGTGKEKGQGDDPKKADGRGDGKEEMDDADAVGGSRKDPRREAVERQEKIVGEARILEEKLKKLEAASNLAKARMAKAAEATEKVAGALARGNTKEATDTAKSGAAQLHELARQVKGEIAREVTEELAMARDLANELAEREAEVAEMSKDSPGGQAGNSQDQPGENGKGEKGKKGPSGAGKGAPGTGGASDLTEAERLERLEEAAKTLEEWLEGASQRAEGKAAEAVRDMLQESDANKVVERMERIGALFMGGEKPEAGKEAKELAQSLEVLAKQLDVLHQGIVAPRLAELVEYDRRVAKLVEELKTLKTDAEITEWHRMATDLVRDMEKAGLAGSAAVLTKMLEDGGWRGGVGNWHWVHGPDDFFLAPPLYTEGLRVVVTKIQDKIQDLILKDLVSDRNEATPPEFKELVERYYEVLSKDSGRK